VSKGNERRLLTSTEVARSLGTGVSSIKRWTNEGKLESIRTAGGHRRYSLDAVHRFAKGRGLPTDGLPRLDDAPAPRTDTADPAEIRAALLDALHSGDGREAAGLIGWNVTRTADPSSFLDRVVGESMRLIGEGWARGSWSVDEEHRASHIVADVLDRLRGDARSGRGRLALLASPPGELHDLPLRMVRLVLEWNGWATDYYGADVPWSALEHAVARGRAAILALTARSSAPFESDEFRNLVRECQARGTRVVAGGEWARGGGRRALGYARIRTLRGFEAWLRQTA
jgi:excisionase family DNA binding protein